MTIKMSMIKNWPPDDLHALANVLHAIDNLHAKEDESVLYPSDEELNRSPSPSSLSSEEQRNLVFAIQGEGAIKIVHEHTLRRGTPYRWSIKVVNPRFKEFESEVEQYFLKSIEHLSFQNQRNGKVNTGLDRKEEQGTPSHSYVLTNSDLVESLERKYTNFIGLPEKGFFYGISDYLKFIDENPGFEEVVSTIDSFREKDKASLLELEKKLLKDIEEVEASIVGSLKGRKIRSKIVNKSLEELEMRKDGRIQSSSSKAEELYSGLGYLITTLNENGYEDVVSDFIKFAPNTKSIVDYKISEHYNQYREELNEFKSRIQKTIWGSWNELVVAYLVVHRYRKRMKELVDANDVIGQMNFHGLHKEMENVLGNAHDESQRLQFIKDDYVIHINRVHDFFINKLNSDPNKNADEEGKGTILKERYESLLNEMKVNKSELDERYKKLLAELKLQDLEKSKAIPEDLKPRLGDSRLEFNSGDGITLYKAAEYIFKEGSKGFALLTLLGSSKNTPFSIDEIKNKCNPLIPRPIHHFKAEKDVWDTVAYMRKMLKVNKNEFFPIRKPNNDWIWVEK